MNGPLKFGMCVLCTRSAMFSKLAQYRSSTIRIISDSWRLFDPLKSICTPLFLITGERGMAGHSKWQNIRHIKGAKDAEKGKRASAMNRKIKLAVKDGGSADPKLNHLLARVIEEANNLDIPKTTIQNAIKQVEKQNKESSILTIECRGPGNCMLIVECMTSKVKYMRQTLASVLNKVGGSVVDKGIAMHNYERKGVVVCSLPADTSLDQDEAEEIAIEVEAEDVSIRDDESGGKTLRFICDMKTQKIVKDSLQELGYEVSSRLEYLPTLCVTLSEQELKLASFMFDKMEELDEVVKIYDNIEVSESV